MLFFLGAVVMAGLALACGPLMLRLMGTALVAGSLGLVLLACGGFFGGGTAFVLVVAAWWLLTWPAVWLLGHRWFMHRHGGWSSGLAARTWSRLFWSGARHA